MELTYVAKANNPHKKFMLRRSALISLLLHTSLCIWILKDNLSYPLPDINLQDLNIMQIELYDLPLDDGIDESAIEEGVITSEYNVPTPIMSDYTTLDVESLSNESVQPPERISGKVRYEQIILYVLQNALNQIDDTSHLVGTTLLLEISAEGKILTIRCLGSNPNACTQLQPILLATLLPPPPAGILHHNKLIFRIPLG